MPNQKHFQKYFSIALLLLLFSSCAPQTSSSIEQASQDISDSLGCVDMNSKVFDAFYKLLDTTQSIPDSQILKTALSKQIETLKNSQDLNTKDLASLTQIENSLLDVIDLMISESKLDSKLTVSKQIQHLIAYEMQAETDSRTEFTQKKIHQILKQIEARSKALTLNCASPTTEQPISSIQSSGQLNKGLNMVFATAYQSCSVLDLPDMDASTAAVTGIKRIGTLPKGGGIRIIDNLKSVQNSHYYIRGQSYGTSCVSVRDNPLIYDFGGKASVSANKLNFFKNAGTGSQALGIDCSGYISAAIGVAGLKYKPELSNKPIYAAYGSLSFLNIKAAKLTCFQNISVDPKTSIQAGDIVAVDGHVVAIDKIGADPFGLQKISSVTQCAKLSYKSFDFTVIQSDPSKGAIGLNKFKANVYLSQGGKMLTAFADMAQQACLAKFQNKTIQPSSTLWSFIRHKGTPECLAPRVAMVNEECTRACLN